MINCDYKIHLQGVDFPDERILDSSLKIDQVQNLLCALGIFPSISEMKEILMEIRFDRLFLEVATDKRVLFHYIFRTHLFLLRINTPCYLIGMGD